MYLLSQPNLDPKKEEGLFLQLEYFLEPSNLAELSRDSFEHYLLELFQAPKFRKHKKLLMQRMGKNIDLIKLYFSEREFDHCLDICAGNNNDPDLPVFYLQLICERDKEVYYSA